MKKHILVWLTAIYLVGGFLLPTLNLESLLPYQFIIAGFIIGYAFKVAKTIMWIMIIVVLIQFILYLNTNTIHILDWVNIF